MLLPYFSQKRWESRAFIRVSSLSMFASLKRGALSLAVVSLLVSTTTAEIFDKLAAVPEGKYQDPLHTVSSSGLG